MKLPERSLTAGIQALLALVLLASCYTKPALLPGPAAGSVRPALQEETPAAPNRQPEPLALPSHTPAAAALPAVEDPAASAYESAAPASDPTAPADDLISSVNDLFANPAGCLSAEEQVQMASVDEMIAYAEQLLNRPGALSKRRLGGAWNAYDQTFYRSASSSPGAGVVALAVDDIKPAYTAQSILNALHVAGFVAWLRSTPQQGLHILAIPLDGSANRVDSPWAAYVEAYWAGPEETPSGDSSVIPALKLPPCRWMIETRAAPQADYSTWASGAAGWPDYARYAAAYQADTMEQADKVAQQINWLGEGLEGPFSMCGPLVWSIMDDAGVFPPGYGDWSKGASAFWLSKPSVNGRPWSLFPPDTYQVYHFSTPLGLFDFDEFPLYPGDFLYTYSKRDGFDHMLLVTEIDEDGNVYTVTNLVREVPEQKITIERVVLYNIFDPSIGVARNEWHTDRKNGRTGHDGFDVFRWAWMEKDILGQPVAYTVQPGDTLGLIAARWRTPAAEIARSSRLSGSSDLTIGQQLVIPPVELPERE